MDFVGHTVTQAPQDMHTPSVVGSIDFHLGPASHEIRDTHSHALPADPHAEPTEYAIVVFFCKARILYAVLPRELLDYFRIRTPREKKLCGHFSARVYTRGIGFDLYTVENLVVARGDKPLPFSCCDFYHANPTARVGFHCRVKTERGNIYAVLFRQIEYSLTGNCLDFLSIQFDRYSIARREFGSAHRTASFTRVFRIASNLQVS